jgi:Flp pilus assembly protein TadD
MATTVKLKRSSEAARSLFATRCGRRDGVRVGLFIVLFAWSAAAQKLPSGTLMGPRAAEEMSEHERRGDELLAARRFDQAIAEYQRALATSPAIPSIHEKLGVAMAASGDMTGAVHEFGEAVRLDPRNARARSDLGMALARTGNRTGALEALHVAVGLDPNDAVSHYRLGVVLSAGEDAGSASEEFRKAAELGYSNGAAFESK